MKGTDGVTARLGASCRRPARGLLVLAALAVAAGAAFAQTAATGPVVSEVKFVGNRHVTDHQLHAAVKTRVGRPFDPVVLKQDVAALNALGTFKARAESGGTRDGRFVVEFIIQEYPSLIQDVRFENARHLNPEEIDSLRAMRKGSPLNPMLARKAVMDIQDFYRQKGYYFCHVELLEGGAPGDSRVIFNVTEGPVVRVRSIRFTGNEQLAGHARLLTQIDTTKKFLGMPFGAKFNPLMVDSDVRKLEEYYKSNGYLEVTVSRQVYFSEDFRSVDVVYNIVEGQRFRVGDVLVQGGRNIADKEFAGILKSKGGEFYRELDTVVDRRNIIDHSGWRGYKVGVQTQLYYPEPGVVQVRHEVLDEQPLPNRVGEIRITGNDVTKERVIRRVLGLYPGQILQYPELRLAEQNLNRLGIFVNDPETGVRPTVTESDRGDGSEWRDIDVHVTEGPTGTIQLGVGVNSDAGLVGNILLNERNFDILNPPTSFAELFSGRAFRGGGQELRIEASPGTEVQRYTVSFREPFLFDRPYSFGASAYYWDRVYIEDTERRLGTRLTLGHQFNRSWSVLGSLRLENVEIEDVPFFAPKDYLDVVGNNFLIAPRVAVVRDTRDSFIKPTEGSYAEASYEQAFGDFTFPVFNVEASKYWTTYQRQDGSGKHVFVARTQFAWAGDDAPVYERFYGGGFRSLRGFSFRGVGPEENGFRVGGHFMWVNTLEYQVPIKANDRLYAVAFVDSGTVERSLTINDYRVTAGFGLRILVPMMGPVPIALDFAFPIVRNPLDNEQIFSFGIQYTK